MFVNKAINIPVGDAVTCSLQYFDAMLLVKRPKDRRYSREKGRILMVCEYHKGSLVAY
jgi:hypothetical protein